ncbi:MAG: type II secretion system F family protein [Candidatus Hydrogenedentota bacterium]|nr:MAG: type II secretion system F family protein [Candidatus Hydrogenedentota bacterium]
MAPFFRYEAIEKGGGHRRVKGTLAAENPRQVRLLLREKGLSAVKIKPARLQSVRSLGLAWVGVLVRQLGTLLRAGFPMDRALGVLARSSSEGSMRLTAMALEESVKKGKALSEAFLRLAGSGEPDATLREVVSVVRAGEATGNLGEVLLDYAILIESRLQFRRKIRSALFYPMVVTVLAVCVVTFLFTYVLPTIRKLFAGTGMDLPLPTKILFGTASAARDIGPWILIAGVILFLLRHRIFPGNRLRRLGEGILLRFPYLRTIVRKAAIVRWARTLARLRRSGVEIVQALDLAGAASAILAIEEATRNVRRKVTGGRSLTAAMREEPIFPPEMIEAVAVGEESDELENILEEMGRAWEEEVSTAADRLAEILEPAVLVVMGIVVGGIVLAVLLPIFEMNASIG